MIKVGISGKIASGKSEVEKIIQKLGYNVFDLDIISREIFNRDDIKNKLLTEFQTLDRKKIGNIVFNNPIKKKNLEKIIHPELKKEIFNLFEKYKNEKIIFISGALLFKSGFYKFFDKNIFVNALDEIRLERLMKRNKLDITSAKSRLNLQDEENLADFIIENNSDIKNLEIETIKLLKTLKKRAI